MFDCSHELLLYHDEKVTLAAKQREEMRDRRNINRTRLTTGLEKLSRPQLDRFVIQGSYAMHTMTQHPKNDYDIDDGAVFKREDLKNKSALQARQMVCDAIQDDRFATPPAICPNCVRVFYNEGFHVDIPVYRYSESGDGLELAGPDWRESKPEGVTNWFASVCDSKSDKGIELRSVVRLLKAFCRSRISWSMPSGFVISVLVSELQNSVDGKLDSGLRLAFENICTRLISNKAIQHPLLNESLVIGKETRVDFLQEKLSWACDVIKTLDEPSCTRLDALQVWKEIFNTNFFDNEIETLKESKSIASATIMTSNPADYVRRDGGGTYGADSSI